MIWTCDERERKTPIGRFKIQPVDLNGFLKEVFDVMIAGDCVVDVE